MKRGGPGLIGLTPDEVHDEYNPLMMKSQLIDIQIKSLIEKNKAMMRQFVPHLNKNNQEMGDKVIVVIQLVMTEGVNMLRLTQAYT